MKTLRLLFNDEMARAVVSGRKTVTRRPVVPMGPQDMQRLIQAQGGKGWPCAPGDLMIGRECWRAFGGIRDVRVDYRADGSQQIIGRETVGVGGARVHVLPDVSKYEARGSRWHPSIHLPGWAARIRRTVVAVSVERLQAITEEDAVREGFASCAVLCRSARDEFADAWDSIYAARGLGWASNCYVWRIEFGAENVSP